MSVYTLHQVPVPLARPRFSSGKVYDSQKDEKTRDMISLKIQHEGKKKFAQPVHLDVEFVFPFPKRFSKKQKDFWNGKPYDNRIDLDNLIKYVADICIGILYDDDKIITSISAKKIVKEHAYTRFMIIPV